MTNDATDASSGPSGGDVHDVLRAHAPEAGDTADAATDTATGDLVRPVEVEPCTLVENEIVVEAGLLFSAEVAGLLHRDGELVLLVLMGDKSGARLYRYDVGGERLGRTDLQARPGSRLLAKGDGLLLLHVDSNQLELERLDAFGSSLSSTRVPLSVGTTSNPRVAAAIDGDLLGVLYLEPSDLKTSIQGSIRFLAFHLDGTPAGDAVSLSDKLTAQPQTVVPTPTGWAATWVSIDDSGSRQIFLSRIGAGATKSHTLLLDTFTQALQGGFPGVPLRADPDGALVAAWLDTRDKAQQDDDLVIWRSNPVEIESRFTLAIQKRSFHVLDLAGPTDDLVVLTSIGDPDDASEVRRFHGETLVSVDGYDAPGVRDRYRALASIPDGYAMAGEEAKVGGTATVKLRIHRCANPSARTWLSSTSMGSMGISDPPCSKGSLP